MSQTSHSDSLSRKHLTVAIIGVVVTLLGIVVALLQPEVRRGLGLGKLSGSINTRISAISPRKAAGIKVRQAANPTTTAKSNPIGRQVEQPRHVSDSQASYGEERKPPAARYRPSIFHDHETAVAPSTAPKAAEIPNESADVLIGTRWLEPGATVNGKAVIMEFLTGGKIRTYSGYSNQYGYVASNVRWYRDGSKVYIRNWSDDSKTALAYSCQGGISSDSIDGSQWNKETGDTRGWHLTRVK